MNRHKKALAMLLMATPVALTGCISSEPTATPASPAQTTAALPERQQTLNEAQEALEAALPVLAQLRQEDVTTDDLAAAREVISEELFNKTGETTTRTVNRGAVQFDVVRVASAQLDKKKPTVDFLVCRDVTDLVAFDVNTGEEVPAPNRPDQYRIEYTMKKTSNGWIVDSFNVPTRELDNGEVGPLPC